MKYIEKHPMIMIVVGIMGISLSAIFVKFSDAPSAVTAALRLLWTVLFMTPAVFGKGAVRRELKSVGRKTALLSALSGLFLAVHFVLWFESLKHTTVASSTTIVCTEVIWVSLGFCLFLKGKISKKAALAIGITLLGSILIALADSGAGEGHLEGDVLAILAAVCSAVYMLFGRSAQKKFSTTVYTYLVYSACAAVLVITCAAQGYSLIAYGWSATIVGLLLAVAITIVECRRRNRRVGICELRLLLDKSQWHIRNLTITVLGDDNLGHTRCRHIILIGRKTVVLRTVDECYNVGILLDSSRLSKVRELWAFRTATILHITAQLRQCYDRHVQLLGNSLQRTRDKRHLLLTITSCLGCCSGHKLQIVYDNELNIVLRF